MRYSIIFGPKRYVDVEMVGEEVHLVDHAEVALGGFYADPPVSEAAPMRAIACGPRGPLRRPLVTWHAGSQSLRSTAPWDEEGGMPAPALRRLVVKSPEMLSLVPEALNPTMGTRYLEAQPSVMRRGLSGNPVALDPGGDLTGWQSLQWFDSALGGTGARHHGPDRRVGDLDSEPWKSEPRSTPDHPARNRSMRSSSKPSSSSVWDGLRQSSMPSSTE